MPVTNRAEVASPLGERGELDLAPLQEARQLAINHAPAAVRTMIRLMGSIGRGAQGQLLAARDLLKFAEGSLAIEPAKVDNAVKLLVVDQSQLAGEALKRKAG